MNKKKIRRNYNEFNWMHKIPIDIEISQCNRKSLNTIVRDSKMCKGVWRMILAKGRRFMRSVE